MEATAGVILPEPARDQVVAAVVTLQTALLAARQKRHITMAAAVEEAAGAGTLPSTASKWAAEAAAALLATVYMAHKEAKGETAKQKTARPAKRVCA